jgi:hypothetical protein
MNLALICEIVVAVCAVLALVGGGIWATFTFFASKAYADALQSGLGDIKKEFDEFKEIVTTHMANEVFYRQQIERRDKVIERAENIFNTVEDKLKSGQIRIVN